MDALAIISLALWGLSFLMSIGMTRMKAEGKQVTSDHVRVTSFFSVLYVLSAVALAITVLAN